MTKPKAATANQQPLEAFAGAWETEGRVYPDPASGPLAFHASDTYEWVPGGFFLLHRFKAHMPDGEIQGIEIIGCDAATGGYAMHSYDSQGTAGVMRAHTDGRVWMFEGDGIRFSGGFRDNEKTFAGTWELQDGADWVRWMDVTLRKRPD